MTLPDRDDRHAALTDFQHNLVVTAGAGTGKTALLVGRLAFALVRLHLEVHEVLALTFTDNAAAEMRERLVRLLRAVEPWLDGDTVEHASDLHTLEALRFGPEDRPRVRVVLEVCDRLPITTFHGHCAALLRRFARRLDLPPEQTIGDEDACHTQFREAFLEHMRRQPNDPVHPALELFEPAELRELGWRLTKIPSDVFGTTLARPSTTDVDVMRADFVRVRSTMTGKPTKFTRKLDAAIAACDWLTDDSVEFEVDHLDDRSGSKKVADDDLERIQRHVDRILPHVHGDDARIGIAVDFVSPLLRAFHEKRSDAGRFTFDDIILETRRHLMRDPGLRREAGGPLRAILVDEFQDTDPLQYDIVFLLAAEPSEATVERPLEVPLRRASLFIVGDPKQSIYRFRGADLAAFDQASRRVLAAGGRACNLVANFRSAPAILELVNRAGEAMLAPNRPYQLGYEPVIAQSDPDDARVELLAPADREGLLAHERRAAEGVLVVQTILRLRGEGVPFRECAILLRAATDTSWLLRVLREVGVPYTLQGSRRFYTRHEVVVATALLAAVARPHDPVGVLGVLRSALSEASDRDVLEFLEQDGTSLDYRESVTGRGPVQRTLQWLGELHARVSPLPLDAALEFLFDLDEWKIAEGSGYEGAQRLANLDKLLTTLRRTGLADLDEAADFAARRTAQETDDEESPLYDRDLDAVRVMTVHAAKGLEFDTVIIPDLARTAQSGGGMRSDADVARVFSADGHELVGIRAGSTVNAASLWIRSEQRRHEEAEERRLFYVAATRAKRRLVMIRSADPGRKGSWQEQLERLDSLPASTITREVEVRRPTPVEPDAGEVSLTATLAAWRAHAALAREPVRPPVPAPIDPITPSLFDRPAAREPHDATAFGTAVHRYLALAELSAGFDADLCADLVDAGDVERLRAVLEPFHDSEFVARIRAADRVRRELPVAHCDSDRGVVHGVLDLLLVEDGRYTVVDHKTDRVASGGHEAAARGHEEQVTRYAESIRRALELDERPARAIYFVRDDVLVDL